MKVSISLFGNSAPQRSPMREWISAFCSALDDELIDTIWFPERHGAKQGVQHAQPLLNMAYAAARLKGNATTVGAGSLVPALHGIQESVDQVEQVESLSLNGARIALGLGWDEEQFARYGSSFAKRQEALDCFVQQIRRYGSFQPAKTLLRTISSDASQWDTAGQGALGIYTASFGRSIEMLTKHILNYRRAIINSPYRVDSGWVACMTHAYIADNDVLAGERYETEFREYLKQHGQRAGIGSEVKEKIITSSLQRMRTEMGLVGAQETVLRRLSDYSKAGVDEIVLLFQYSDDLGRELEQLELIQEVLRRV